jgi:hypothetical protein
MSGTRHTTSGIGELDAPRRERVSHKNPDVVLVGKLNNVSEYYSISFPLF